MNFNPTHPDRYGNLAAHAGPSPIGNWLSAALRRLTPDAAPGQPSLQRDRAREATEARAMAEVMRRTDPRAAEDLFAAADRHEAQLI